LPTHGPVSSTMSRIAVAQRKLDQVNRAQELQDLGFPPGNRIERLKGSRMGQHSINLVSLDPALGREIKKARTTLGADCRRLPSIDRADRCAGEPS